MTRRSVPITAIGGALLACCLFASLCLVAHPVAAGPGRGPAGRGPGARATLAAVQPLAACEARLERERSRGPTVAIVGASYTAGVGPGSPQLSWAVQLARLLRWNAVIYGVSGAGYVRRGPSGRGPMARLLAGEGLRGLRPALVIIQAGHDDAGLPLALERRRVTAAVDQVRAAAPRSRIALLTTFATRAGGTAGLRETNDAIVTAGRAADPQVIIVNPLAGRWKYAHAGDGLHPTAAGDAWIARTMEAILLGHGLRAAPETAAAPFICDLAVGAGPRAGVTA